MRFANVLICVAVTLLVAGCGAIFQGSTQDIDVQSSPAGSKVTGEPTIGEYTTPTVLKLERSKSYTLHFSKEGYESASVQITKRLDGGMLVLDILFTGLIGVIVDAATGSWNDLKPETAIATLTKLETGLAGPQTIEVAVSVDGETFKIESSQPGVGVSVE